MSLIAALAAVWLASAPAAPTAAACALAEELVSRQVVSHPLPAMQVVAERVTDFSGLDEGTFGSRDGATPPASLVRAYLGRGEASVLACPNVRAKLDAQGSPYGAEAEARTEAFFKAPFDRADPPYVMHYISLPVMSADGRQALVAVGSRCKGLCGLWTIQYFRKGRDGRWTSHTVGPIVMS